MNAHSSDFDAHSAGPIFSGSSNDGGPARPGRPLRAGRAQRVVGPLGGIGAHPEDTLKAAKAFGVVPTVRGLLRMQVEAPAESTEPRGHDQPAGDVEADDARVQEAEPKCAR